MFDRGTVFRDFLEGNSFYIDYNGVRYTLVDKNNNMIIQTNTDDEMYMYILGYNKATNICNQKITELEDRNQINIERYEKLINEDEGEN
jgi:hypothetical protein